jgi:glycosyltransferase involved in cell wall biosynthesis
MTILMATEVIQPGGAETYVLRMAESLQKKGHKVSIFLFYKDQYNQELHLSIAPNVEVTPARIRFSKLVKKFDSLLFKLNIDYSLRNNAIKNSLKKVIKRIQPNVIHSNLLKVDRICCNAAAVYHIPVVTTIHGDYLQFFNKLRSKKRIPLHNYKEKAIKNLQELKKIVCISDKQIAFFHDVFPEETSGKLVKIYNGFTGNGLNANTGDLRQRLKIELNDFVFVMASRGIKEKGWDVAINAFINLKKKNMHLILVGQSDYLKKLKEKYSTYRNIHFAGHSNNPMEWISICNAGLLPSTYASESLPTAVIEYLYCGIPVIASDAGEIRNMLTYNGNEAGIVIPIINDKIAVTDVTTAMEKYIDDKSLYDLHRSNTALCSKNFDMDKCISGYLNVYNEAIMSNQTK